MVKRNAPTYELLLSAKADIREIWRYTHQQWGEAQAEEYVRALYKQCDAIARNPKLGRSTPELSPTLRVVTHTHHRIFYIMHQNKVSVVAILHERQDLLANLAGRI